MAVHYGDKGRGLYGALSVREGVTVGGNVTAEDVLVDEYPLSKTPRHVKLDLAVDSGNGAGFSWAVPGACIVGPVIVNIIEAPHVAGRTLDIGVAASATTKEDNLIDGLGFGTTDDRQYTSISAHGTNGRGMYVAAAGEFVTGTNSGQLTGDPNIDVHIFYTLL